MNGFPARRLRRLRRSPGIRALVRETRLSCEDLIYPVFVAEAERDAREVSAMPGVRRHTLDQLEKEVAHAADLGVRAILLFAIPASKDATGSAAWAEDGIIPQALQRLRRAVPDVVLLTDVCLCEYTNHGHCGIIRDGHAAGVVNDESIELLGRIAVAHARAGADVVAPSAMLDGMVSAIRTSLDVADLSDVAILSYAVKYASTFYAPFRDAADCAPAFGDRRSHQMDPANASEAIAEAELDLQEGADMLMVKPALPYLDVIRLLHERFPAAPLAAYQVSGEYSMIKAAAERGWLDERQAVLEALTGIRRAGARMIITYFAKEAAVWLRD